MKFLFYVKNFEQLFFSAISRFFEAWEKLEPLGRWFDPGWPQNFSPPIPKNPPPLRYVGGSTWVVRKKVTDLTFRITKQSAALKKKKKKEKKKRKS